jgi:hypothetical protein
MRVSAFIEPWRALAAVLRIKAGAGIQFNEHCDDRRPMLFFATPASSASRGS